MEGFAELTEALEHAESLRERVIRSAWALHFAADNAAACSRELRASCPGAGPVSGGPTALERWWTRVSEDAIAIVREWDQQAREQAHLSWRHDETPAT
jgi:hypothetical protein